MVDEVDQIADPVVRRSIAFLVKQLGDRECPVKFIFVGIAEDVAELLEHHESASRYIASIRLDRLPFNVLKSIVTEGFHKIDAELWDPLATRVAFVSDGFAHFTHLVGLKMAMRLLDDNPPNLQVSVRHLELALADAVEDSESWLKTAYDDATQKYQDKYEHVLWAAADHWEIERSTEHMYPCYLRICERAGVSPLERQQFSAVLSKFKTERHGGVLVSRRRSWYRFRQTMLRGYCRMVASTRGIEVGRDYLAGK